MDDLKHLARVALHDREYTPPAPTGYTLPGFWSDVPYGDLLEMWLRYRDHGLFPFEGGYLDQPPEIMRDFRKLREVYAYWMHEIRTEIEDRPKP